MHKIVYFLKTDRNKFGEQKAKRVSHFQRNIYRRSHSYFVKNMVLNNSVSKLAVVYLCININSMHSFFALAGCCHFEEAIYLKNVCKSVAPKIPFKITPSSSYK